MRNYGFLSCVGASFCFLVKNFFFSDPPNVCDGLGMIFVSQKIILINSISYKYTRATLLIFFGLWMAFGLVQEFDKLSLFNYSYQKMSALNFPI